MTLSDQNARSAEADVPCVGGLAYDPQGRLLLVLRANEPDRGRWSVPGGRVEPGEDDATAVAREMLEETGLRVRPGGLVGRVRVGRYVISDYACEVVGGTLRAGDDAADARWFGLAEMTRLPLAGNVFLTLREWGALPS